MEYIIIRNNDELYHYGVKGMKWGIRRDPKSFGYKSTGIKSALARRSNEKIDASFKKWDKNNKKKANAVELGKKANISKRLYEDNKSDKGLKSKYKQDVKDYKKALRGNTTYRKGQIKKEVGQDLSRKYLSDAKKVKKQLISDPTNKKLQKQYSELMSKHDVERANARRAPKVASKRSYKKAAIKRSMTMSLKAATTTVAIAGGAYILNKYLNNHQVTLNGNRVYFSTQKVRNVMGYAKTVRNFMDYAY